MSDDLMKAILAILGGGVGAGIIQLIATRQKESMQDSIAKRAEWREEVVALRQEVRRLSDIVEDWQAKYHVRGEELALLKAEHKLCTERTEQLEQRINILEKKQNGAKP